jgi:hypothetical protein
MMLISEAGLNIAPESTAPNSTAPREAGSHSDARKICLLLASKDITTKMLIFWHVTPCMFACGCVCRPVVLYLWVAELLEEFTKHICMNCNIFVTKASHCSANTRTSIFYTTNNTYLMKKGTWRRVVYYKQTFRKNMSVTI